MKLEVKISMKQRSYVFITQKRVSKEFETQIFNKFCQIAYFSKYRRKCEKDLELKNFPNFHQVANL